MAYDIRQHKHSFYAWAAGRAASRGVAGFDGEQGRRILDALNFADFIASPDRLPTADTIDAVHREWRRRVLRFGNDLRLSHGIAAKLINVYMKAAFVCGGFHEHPNVGGLHPPIDRLMLDELAKRDVGGLRRKWRAYHDFAWTTFDSDQYESVVADVRSVQGDQPLWMIEQHWRGYQ